jgi:hypothetical protein
MKQELDDELCSKYPEIFADRHRDMTETCMCWGIETGDGWYRIIDQLCGSIQNHIDWRQKNHDWAVKWNAEHPDNPRAVPEPVPQVVAEQVKEKYGTLRFYYRGGDDVVDGMVRMAESMSGATCDQCGAPGELGGQGWISTRCEEHRKVL